MRAGRTPGFTEAVAGLADAEVRPEVALAEVNGETGTEVDADRKLLAAVERLHESNPMLGLRGVRLGLLTPGWRWAGSSCCTTPPRRRPGAGPGGW